MRTLSFPTLLTVAAALTLSGCIAHGSDAPADTPSEGLPVSVSTVGREDVSDEITYVADLSAWSQVRLYSPVSDRILSFPYDEGDVVAEGEVVAQVRSEGLDAGVAQIRAQLESLDIQIEAQQADLERTAELLAAGVVTERTYEQAEASYAATLAQRRSTAASLDQISVSAGNAVITAPIHGVIASRSLDVGDMASPQTPLCTILEIDTIRIELDLVEADVSKVRVGQEVRVQVDAWPARTFIGELSRILPYVDPATRTNTAVVRIDNPIDDVTGLRALKPGMYGTAHLVVSERPDALVAPAQALLLDTEVLAAQQPGETLRKAYVVLPDGTVEERLVTVGARLGDRWEVLSGLEAGEPVVVRGQHRLSDGDHVRMVVDS